LNCGRDSRGDRSVKLEKEKLNLMWAERRKNWANEG